MKRDRKTRMLRPAAFAALCAGAVFFYPSPGGFAAPDGEPEAEVKTALADPQGALDKSRALFQEMAADPALSKETRKKAQAAADRALSRGSAASESRWGAADRTAKQGSDSSGESLREDVRRAAAVLKSAEADRLPEANRKRFRNEAAAVSVDLGQYRDGAELSQKVLEADPRDRDALGNMAKSNYGLGDYEAAIRYATRLTDVRPDDASAYTTRALAHYASGNFLQAIEDSKKALALDKDDEIAFATLKVAQNRLHPTSLRLDEKQSAEAESVRKTYQEMLEQKNEEQAVERVGPPPSAYPRAETAGGERAYYRKAAAENVAGSYGRAVQDASAALALDPKDTAALDARATAYVHLGRYHEAMEDATRAIGLDATDAYAYAIRARVHEKEGEVAAMLADYREAARLNPQFEPAWRAAAQAHAAAVEDAPATEGFFRNFTARPANGRFAGFPLALAFSLVGLLLIGLGVSHVFHSPGERRSLSSNYKILRRIGEGGMSVVYEGMDTMLKRPVAIKRMREDRERDPHWRIKFLREARTVAALHHPNIVEIYSIVEQQDGLYLVFERIAGRSLDEVLAAKKRFSLKEALPVVEDICGALEYAHEHGVIHSDLKPANVMMTEEGRAKVMDFGIAHRVQEPLKRPKTETLMGTPQYMSPEAEQGLFRLESDIYALGVCLYEMLVGERPFAPEAASFVKVSRGYAKPSSRVAGLPKEIDSLIDDALHPEADSRIHSTAEFLARLRAAAPPAQAAAHAHG